MVACPPRLLPYPKLQAPSPLETIVWVDNKFGHCEYGTLLTEVSFFLSQVKLNDQSVGRPGFNTHTSGSN